MPEEHNPRAFAGETYAQEQTVAPLPASERKWSRGALQKLAKDELRRIPVLRAGEPLTPGATYIDLAAGCEEFTATGGMVATQEHWYVRKDTVDFQLWNKLTGARNAEELGTGNG